MAFQTQQVLSQGAGEEKAEVARMSSFVGAIAIGDLVKSTLGPKGMDKILMSAAGGIDVTNDGATILKSIAIDNAAAKILIDLSKVQDDEVGDGTTSVAVLAAELLREAELLVAKKIHPQTIIGGWRKALSVAKTALEGMSEDMSPLTPEQFHGSLFSIASTTLSSKILTQHKDYFSNMAVDAILRLKGSGNLDAIQILQKSGGQLSDSYLDEGFILDKKIGVNQPKRLENCKILIANTPMDADKIKIFGSKIQVDAISKVANIEVAEKQKMKDKVNRIINHKCTVFINRQLIYNYPEQLFADAGVMAIEHADFEGVERLALVTGGEIVSTFDTPEIVKLGECDVIEEIVIGEDKLIKFSGVKLGEACSIVLRGATKTILAEAERSLHDALCVLQQTVEDPRCIYGGGAAELCMSEAIVRASLITPGKESMAMESFAKALRTLPTALADNGGFDSAQLLSTLRAKHNENVSSTAGLNMKNGTIGDAKEMGLKESYKVKLHMLIAAAEAAELIVRVDDLITAAPRKRQGGH